MAKLMFHQQLHDHLRAGAEQMTRVVAANYGPKGRNTICDQKYDLPMVVNTGRQILRDFALVDPAENLAAALVRDAGLKIAGDYGDGAITTVILSNALIQEGFRLISAGYNPMQLRQAILGLLPLLRSSIEEMEVPAEQDLLERFLDASSKHSEISQVIKQAIGQVGINGMITVQDSQRKETQLDCWEGIRYDTGLLSTAFAANQVEKSVTLDSPYVLLSNVKIRSIQEPEGILYEVMQRDAALLIITSDMDENVQRILASNAQAGRLRLAVAKAPGYGDTRRRNMLSLAAKIGSLLIDENRGIQLEKCGLEICAQIDRCEIDKENTLLQGFSQESAEMVEILRKHTSKALQTTKEAYTREELEITLSILNGKAAQIQVGGPSEYEMFEKKYLYENMICAVRSAARSGLVPGAANLCAKLAAQLRAYAQGQSEILRVSALCLSNALCAPIRILADNAGLEGSSITERVLQEEDVCIGYDVRSEQMVLLQEHGILMPENCAQALIETAIETAVSLWTASAAVVS